MKRIAISILFFILAGAIFAQNLEIKLKLPSAANKKVTLAYYYNSQILIQDTLVLDGNGAGVFKNDTAIHQGLYKIFLDGKNHFDFLLGEDQTFSMANDDFSVDNMKVNGAIETKEFADYMKFLKDLQIERKELSDKMGNAPEDAKKGLEEKMKKLSSSVEEYWLRVEKKYPGTFLAKFLMANYTTPLDEESIPEEVRANDSMLLRYKFDYQKEHYFDHFDLLDERLFYTPLTKPRIETYYTKVLLQTFDSIYAGSLDLLETIKPNKKLFQYVCSYILNNSINSNIMGMDALFVEIARRYYMSGEAFWANEKTLENIRENLMFTEHNLIGMTAPELQLEGTNPEEQFSLHQVDAKLTLVVIYEPNCEHCKVFVPKLHKQVYEKYKDKGFEVFAIYSMDKKDEWLEFIEKHGLDDWINVWDEHDFSRFKITYDARKTPGVYLLDKDKKIIAKKLSVEQVEKYLERLLD